MWAGTPERAVAGRGRAAARLVPETTICGSALHLAAEEHAAAQRCRRTGVMLPAGSGFASSWSPAVGRMEHGVALPQLGRREGHDRLDRRSPPQEPDPLTQSAYS
jgi:hypothetical protein